MPYLIYLNGNLLCPAPDIVYWTIEHLWQRPTPYAAAEFIGRRVSPEHGTFEPCMACPNQLVCLQNPDVSVEGS
jgi:hypothetical protein